MSTRLCAVCNGIFTGLLVVQRKMPHHQSVASLRRSAHDGCYICNLVAVMLEHEVSNDIDSFQWSLELSWEEADSELSSDEEADSELSSEEEAYSYGFYREHGRLHILFHDYDCVFNLMDTTSPNAPIHSVLSGASVTDQAVMETARSWLENCRQNHAWCEPVDPTFNPTRLIYIHDTSSVQLIETKKEAKSHAYVAFSHCWGKSKTLKLLQDDLDKGTKGNIEELRSLIQVQRLPTSYREAISVSLALGFRHIWIDSLCIIQNSHDDWAKEAAMMKDVYANCSLNLCASAAADASEASFQRRDLGTMMPLDLEPRWTDILDLDDSDLNDSDFDDSDLDDSDLDDNDLDDNDLDDNGLDDNDLDDTNGNVAPLPSYLHQIKFKLVNTMMYKAEIFNSPLTLRAWVVQERTLSRRHLYMTCNQLWWECHDMCACEVFPAGVPDGLDPDCKDTWEEERIRYYTLGTHGHHTAHDRAVLDGSPGGQTESTRGELARRSPFERLSEDDMDELWVSLVERYSRCGLTYSSDKLPALSGLAQVFSIVRGPGFSLDGNSYLAGIWRPHLPNALCWYQHILDKENRKVCHYRPHPYRAPSWSWASVEGLVADAAGSLSCKPACSVVDVKVLYEDERYKASTVKGGILHLRSRLVGPFTYEKSSQSNLTTSPSLDSRVRKAIDAPRQRWSTLWDECDDDSGKDFISYLDPLPHTVHKDGILKGTGAVRKRVRLGALTEEPRIRLFVVPIIKNSYGFEGLILCQVVNNPGLEGVDEGVVFQRVGYFMQLKTKRGVLDLVPERTIAII